MMISDLPIGAKVKFGAYSVAGEAPHKISWIKVHGDNTLLAEFIEDQCAFDAKEKDNTVRDRRAYGNNRYALSNVHQFLNSFHNDWFTKQHEFDAPPEDENMYGGQDGYVDKPGFLTNFDEWEVDAIEESEVTTALPRIETGDGLTETIQAKIFLPSKFNLFGRTENGVEEGDYWDFFANDGGTACQMSGDCYYDGTCRTKPDEDDDNWYYLLRSPYADGAHGVRCVDTYGDADCYSANDGIMGVRPALKLNPEILISEEPDENGYYEVINVPQEVFDIDEDSFFAILSM